MPAACAAGRSANEPGRRRSPTAAASPVQPSQFKIKMNFSWITFTHQDVLNNLTPVETAALQSVQGAVDGLTAQVAKATTTLRGKCKAGGNQLGPDGTIPASLLADAVALATWLWLSSFPKN